MVELKYYTGIGSRSTPADIQKEMTKVALGLAGLCGDYVLRSGKAKGADEAFQKGVQRAKGQPNLGMLCEIYIPWKGFKGAGGLLDTWDILLPPDKEVQCMEIVSQYHPAWHRCSQGAKKLHARNVAQVLGYNLDKPSDFVLFWAEEVNGKVRGGTATAVNIARHRGIPTINMAFEGWFEKLKEVCDDKSTR